MDVLIDIFDIIADFFANKVIERIIKRFRKKKVDIGDIMFSQTKHKVL